MGPIGPVAPVAPVAPAGPIGPSGPASPCGPREFQETAVVPKRQFTKAPFLMLRTSRLSEFCVQA